jgi:hypothetical protein
MVFKIITLLSVLMTIVVYSSCSSVKYKYKYKDNYKHDGYPKEVFIDDQIHTLNSNGNLMEDQRSYAEIITIDGNHYEGKLFNISYQYITLSIGSDVDFKDRIPLDQDEVKIEIPKEDVIVLKVW